MGDGVELLAVQRKAQGLRSTGSLLLELWMESWVEPFAWRVATLTHLQLRLSLQLLLRHQPRDTYCSERGPQPESGTNLQGDKKKAK